MIHVIGDNFEELAVLQSLIITGILNDKHQRNIDIINIGYKLSSGNILLVDEYDNIVGEKESEDK